MTNHEGNERWQTFCLDRWFSKLLTAATGATVQGGRLLQIRATAAPKAKCHTVSSCSPTNATFRHKLGQFLAASHGESGCIHDPRHSSCCCLGHYGSADFNGLLILPTAAFLFLLQDWLHDSPQTFAVTSEHIRFYFLVFLFYAF